MSEATKVQKRCAELLPVIKAGSEGRVIQVRVGENCWVDLRDANVGFFEENTYRVRPEPTFRTFNRNEAFDLIGKEVINRTNGERKRIEKLGRTLGRDCVWFCTGTHTGFDHLLEAFKFADGSPCGVKECAATS